jgi:hypothetical protein
MGQLAFMLGNGQQVQPQELRLLGLSYKTIRR